MRALKILVLALAPMVVLTACDQKKSDAATTASGSYDTSAEANQRFLADYAKRDGVKKTGSGLMYRVMKAGTGPQTQKDNDIVTVYYKGSLITGKVFDQTKPEEPAQFPVGGVIPGWIEALKMMKTGDTWELVIPSELGYGAEGAGADIPPNQTLVFQVSLAKVEYAP